MTISVPAACTGSSPQMRGARIDTHRVEVHRRIIPEDAGSTMTKRPSSILATDHPRGCGEHVLEGDGFTRMPGSSPQMRGAHLTCRHAQYWGRIIPADAGSTTPEISISRDSQDHPRRCGEHTRDNG